MARGAALCEEPVAVDLSKGVMSADQIQSLFALAMGFAFAGVIASGYQLVTRRPASFRLLQRGPRRCDLRRGAAGRLRGALHHHAQHHPRLRASKTGGFSMVMLATIIAGVWSLMSGTVVMMALTVARCCRRLTTLANSHKHRASWQGRASESKGSA